MSTYWTRFEELRLRLDEQGHRDAVRIMEVARGRYDGTMDGARRLLDDVDSLTGPADGWAERDREDLHWLSVQVSRPLQEGEPPELSIGIPSGDETAEALLRRAKDTYLNAGLSQGSAERRQLYGQAAALFAAARRHGPIPKAMERFERTAKDRS